MDIIASLSSLFLSEETLKWLGAISLALIGLRHLVKLTPTPKDDAFLNRAIEILDKILGARKIR